MKLLEVDYNKIFSPKTMAALKGKSGESLRQMLGGGIMQRLPQVMGENMQLLQQIAKAEAPYKDLLEQLAVQMVEEAYPIINYANIKIDAKLTNNTGMSKPPDEDEESGGENPELAPDEMKRKVINGITQGASIRGTFGFLLFKEYLDQIDDKLVDQYKRILQLTFGVFDDEAVVALLMSMMASSKQLAQSAGGESEAEYDEMNQQFVIKARAINFPFLVHEIVKGLYEIVSLQGFGTDKERNKTIVNKVDKLTGEPDDMRYGKFIYDAISDIYNESDFNDSRIKEFLFTELYKLPDEDFVPFIENAINGELTPAQKRWALNTMRDINDDLKKDDTGLEDLL